LLAAPGDDDANSGDPACDSGAVYVFRRDGESWLFDAKLTATDGDCGDRMGREVALDGDLAVFGVPLHQPSAQNPIGGAVYVFRRTGGGWSSEAKLVPESDTFAFLGTSVSTRNGIIAARVTDLSDFGPSGGFRIRVFRKVVTDWELEASLESIDPQDGDRFAEDIETDGIVIVAGTPWNAPPPDSAGAESIVDYRSGSAHLFRWSETAWKPEGKVFPGDGQYGDEFGLSVSVEGDRILVGSLSHDGLGPNSDTGSGYFFKYNGALWQENVKLLPADIGAGDLFGWTASQSAPFLALGAALDDDACPQDPSCDSGAAYVYWLGATIECAPIPAISTLGLVLFTAILLFAGSTLIGRRARAAGASTRIIIVVLMLALSDQRHLAYGELIPRVLPNKPAQIEEPTEQFQLEVKFLDELKVRADDGDLYSLVSADLSVIESVQGTYSLTFAPVVALSEETIASIVARAETMSGRAQPDIAAIMQVNGPAEELEAAANALLDLDETEWVAFVIAEPEPPCEAISPPGVYHFQEQTYHNADPGLNMAYAWSQGAKGLNIQFADIEYGYNENHEDLCNIQGPTICLDLATSPQRGHGTAVLGELSALDNDYGCTGLVPDATAWFFSEFQPDPPPEGPCRWRRAMAIEAATDVLGSGDVMVLEMQLQGAPAETGPAVFNVSEIAVNCGIIVVCAAGNGDNDLDSAAYDDYRANDSGAIIVGSGSPTTAHTKRFDSTYGSRVNVQGWGDNVYTLCGSNEAYGNCVNATSAATPFVAAAAISLQSYVEQHYGCRIGPRQMRRLLIDTGICQGDPENGHIGPFPDMQAAIERVDELFGDPQDPVDCNENEISDLCDVGIIPQFSGPPESADANHNLVPDECEPNDDCNNNEVADLTDIGTETSHDCNRNSLPDECDIASETSEDCDENGFPDECDTSSECLDGVPPFIDCNANDVSDVCDIASGTSYDCDLTGVLGKPDECEGGKACCDPWTGECVTTFESCCDALGGEFYSPKTCDDTPPWTCPTYNFTEP
jgi:hypothetical protein